MLLGDESIRHASGGYPDFHSDRHGGRDSDAHHAANADRLASIGRALSAPDPDFVTETDSRAHAGGRSLEAGGEGSHGIERFDRWRGEAQRRLRGVGVVRE
jgi:hypothetical protein